MSRLTVSEEDIMGEGELEDQPEEEVDEFTIMLNKEIAECFSIFDKNKSKTFEAKYLSKAMASLGISLSLTDLQESKENLDNDGVVDFDVFKSFALEKMQKMVEPEVLTAAFQVFDPDNEGVVPSSRFKRWMLTKGTPLTEKEVKQLVKLGDPGNKGFIVYEDLIGKLCAQ